MSTKSREVKEWTNHELRSAQARALQEKGNDYILPIRVDETDLAAYRRNPETDRGLG